MNKKVLLIIGGVLAVLCCIGIIIAAAVGGLAAFGITQQPASVGDSFMGALKDGDYNKAYGLCTEDLQGELGGAQDLRALIEDADVRPTKWSFTSRNVSGDEAELTGDVTFTNNREGTVELVLFKIDGNWRVAGFNLTEK